MSNLDWDELYEEIDNEEEFKPKVSKKNKQRKKSKSKSKGNKKQDKEKKNGISVTMYVITIVVLAFVSLMLLMMGYSNGLTTGRSEVKIPVVDNVVPKPKLQDVISDFNDTQVMAVREQFNAVKPKQGEDKSNVGNEAIFEGFKKMNNNASKTLDPFFNTLLQTKRHATEGELDNVKKKLEPLMVESVATNLSYDIVNGMTPAKQLDADGVKSGAVFPSAIGMNPSKMFTYLVVVPFTTEKEETYNVEYIVSLDKDGKVQHISYGGYLQVEGNDPKLFYNDLAKSLKQVNNTNKK